MKIAQGGGELTNIMGQPIQFLDRIEFMPVHLQRFHFNQGREVYEFVRTRPAKLLIEHPMYSPEQQKIICLLRCDFVFNYNRATRGSLFCLWITHQRAFRRYFCVTTTGNYKHQAAGRMSKLLCAGIVCRQFGACLRFGSSFDCHNVSKYVYLFLGSTGFVENQKIFVFNFLILITVTLIIVEVIKSLKLPLKCILIFIKMYFSDSFWCLWPAGFSRTSQEL